jgi:hypothetical protein
VGQGVPNTKLNVHDLNGILTFTIQNRAPSAITQYTIETWATYAHGVRRICSIAVTNAYIASGSTGSSNDVCVLRPDSDLGPVLSHVSRIVSVQWASGFRWHIPVSYPVSKVQ